VNENTTPTASFAGLSASTAKTAAPDTPTADPDASAAFRAKEAFGRTHAARFIARLGCLLDELNDYKADGHAPNGGPSGALGFTLDGIIDAALGFGQDDAEEGLPGLGACVTTYEGCAAFAAALFGKTIIVDDSDAESDGARAQTAFLVARAYLAAPMNSAGSYLLLAAALAVQRDTRKREQEESEPATA